MRLEVNEDRAVALPLALRPIVHPERAHWPGFRQRCGAHEAQERTPTDRDTRRSRMSGTGGAAQGKARALEVGAQLEGAPCGGCD